MTFSTNGSGTGVITVSSTGGGGSGTNSVSPGTLTTVATNGVNYAVSALSQTNNQTSVVFSNVTTFVYTNQLITLTNQFATTNFAKSMTNGMTSITTSNASAFVITNSLPALTNRFAVTNDSRTLSLSSTSSIYAGQLTNGINRGNAFSSPGAGSRSEQLGNGADASGDDATAVGTSAQALKSGDTSLGVESDADGPNAFSAGSFSSAQGAEAYVAGNGSSAGVRGMVIGNFSTAAWSNSIAIGNAVGTTQPGEILIGNVTNFVRFPGNGTIAGIFTNGTTVMTNLFSDRDVIVQFTTNNIFVTNAGTPLINGTYVYGTAAVYTNTQDARFTLNFQNPTWFLSSNAANFYSASSPASTSWSIVSGASAAPTTGFGAIFRLAGETFDGYFSSTNLDQRFLALTNYGISILQSSTNYSITILQASTNYTLVASNNLRAFITNSGSSLGILTNSGSGTNNRFSSSTTVNATIYNLSTISNIDVNGWAVSNIATLDFVGFGASYVWALDSANTRAADGHANYAGMFAGTFNQLSPGSGANNATRSVILGGNQNFVATGTGHADSSATLGGYANNIALSSATANYDAILGGTLNTIGGGTGGAYYSGILAGQGNSISLVTQDSHGATIDGGLNNSIGFSDSSAIVNGELNRITNSTYSTILGGYNNSISGGYVSTVGGSLAVATNEDVFVWNDGAATFTSKTNQSFLIKAANGVGINTNYAGTNALRVNGSIDSTVGFFVNGAAIGSSSTVTTNNLVATNSASNISLSGIVYTGTQTNQTFSTTNFAVSKNQSIFYSTNVLVIEGAAGNANSVKSTGTYQWNSTLGLYNFNGFYVTNISAIWYLETEASSILYSSSGLETNSWTRVNGGATKPSSQFGGYISMRGLVPIYDEQSTNIAYQITNYSQRIPTNSASVSDGMVATATGRDFKLVTLGTALTNNFVLTAGSAMTGTLTNNSGIYGNATGLTNVTASAFDATGSNTINQLISGSSITSSDTSTGIVLNITKPLINPTNEQAAGFTLAGYTRTNWSSTIVSPQLTSIGTGAQFEMVNTNLVTFFHPTFPDGFGATTNNCLYTTFLPSDLDTNRPITVRAVVSRPGGGTQTNVMGFSYGQGTSFTPSTANGITFTNIVAGTGTRATCFEVVTGWLPIAGTNMTIAVSRSGDDAADLGTGAVTLQTFELMYFRR